MPVPMYLNVDGCVNIKVGADSDGFALRGSKTYPIRWNSEIIRQLALLDVEPVWVSNWGQDAIDVIAPIIGWGRGGRVLLPSGLAARWKLDAINQDRVANPGPFIHIDHQLTSAHLISIERAGGLGISTNIQTGIKRQHIKAIKSYLKELR